MKYENIRKRVVRAQQTGLVPREPYRPCDVVGSWYWVLDSAHGTGSVGTSRSPGFGARSHTRSNHSRTRPNADVVGEDHLEPFESVPKIVRTPCCLLCLNCLGFRIIIIAFWDGPEVRFRGRILRYDPEVRATFWVQITDGGA